MKKTLSIALVLALMAANPHARCYQSTSPSLQQASTSAKNASSPETIIIRKGTRMYLRAIQSASSKTAKVGDRVTFEVEDDLSSEGLTVVSKGAKVGASVTEARKSGLFFHAPKLSVTFDDLPLVTGQTVPVQEPKVPPSSFLHDLPDFLSASGIVFVALSPLAAFVKLDDATLGPKSSVQVEIVNDINLDKVEVNKLQGLELNWKTRVEQLLADHVAPLNARAPVTFDHDLETGEELMELDLSSGIERRVLTCKHCFSPIVCIHCFDWKEYSSIFFLQADGIYFIETRDGDLSVGKNVVGWNILKGSFSSFSRILAVLDRDLVVLQSTQDSCKILRIRTIHYFRIIETVDAMDCKELSGIHPQQRDSLLRPAQILGDKYIAEIPSSTSPGRDLTIGLVTTDSSETGLQSAPVPQLDQTYNRFDPIWFDPTHILYMRHKL